MSMTMVTVRVCLESGLMVRLRPGDRCLRHALEIPPCGTALRELPDQEAIALMHRSSCYDHIPEMKA
jgi:hypothetical protein